MSDESLENISEADREFAKLAKGLADDPKTRKEFLKLIKSKHPNQVIPEIDTEADIQKFAQPYLDKLAAMEKKDMEREVSARISARRSELKEQGFSNDDIKAIEERMVKESIPDHNTMAKYYKMERETSVPTVTAKDMVTKLPIDKKLVKEAGGIKTWARQEAYNAVADVKSGRVKLH